MSEQTEVKSQTSDVSPAPSAPRLPLISEHVKGDSTCRHMSVRALIALLVAVTLCAIVLIVVIRTADVDKALPTLKDLWQPICLLVFAFYFTIKSPNNNGGSKPQ